MKNLRAFIRSTLAVAALPVALGLIALQGFVIGPVFKNTTAVPGLIYNGLRRLLGYKVIFNAASKPPRNAAGQPTWFVLNHMSIADFVVAGSKLDGTFAGKGDVLKWPLIAQMARAVKYIGLRRSSQYNAESRGKIIENFNAGLNTIMFPEGTTSDGKEVHLFRAALPSLLYGEEAVTRDGTAITLEKSVMVQPVAIKVARINGTDAAGRDDLRDLYSMADENHTLRRLWKRLQIRETVLELTAFDPIDPASCTDAKELMNTAALQIASVVNPGQTSFTKASIPGQPAPRVEAAQG